MTFTVSVIASIVFWVGILTYGAARDTERVYDYGDCVHTIRTENTVWWESKRTVIDTYDGEGC